jgi:hypothetical protein
MHIIIHKISSCITSIDKRHISNTVILLLLLLGCRTEEECRLNIHDTNCMENIIISHINEPNIYKTNQKGLLLHVPFSLILSLVWFNPHSCMSSSKLTITHTVWPPQEGDQKATRRTAIILVIMDESHIINAKLPL